MNFEYSKDWAKFERKFKLILSRIELILSEFGVQCELILCKNWVKIELNLNEI